MYRVSSDGKRRSTAELHAYAQVSVPVSTEGFCCPDRISLLVDLRAKTCTRTVGFVTLLFWSYLYPTCTRSICFARTLPTIDKYVIDAETSVRDLILHKRSERHKSQGNSRSTSRSYNPST